MYRTLKGYCDIQEKDTIIQIKMNDSSAMEDMDIKGKFAYGRIECNYVSNGGKCNGKNCSILKQHGIER